MTTSFGLHHYVQQQPDAFVWYETSIFDLQRSQSEWVAMDTISHAGIVHGVLGGASHYHAWDPSSSASSSQPFAEYRFFNFTICGVFLLTNGVGYA